MAPELLGFLLGVIAGLIPGIHPNTFSAILIGSSGIFLRYYSGDELAIIVFVSSIVYSVVNIIPAVFIGVPDEDTALSVFPAHRMVLDGNGFKAISISAFSSLFSALMSIPLYYLVLLAGRQMDLTTFTFPVLFAVSLYLLMLERDEFGGGLAKWKKRGYAFTVFMLSGFLGLFSLRYFGDDRISILFPMLSGFFAFPTLVLGLKSQNIPDQKIEFSLPSSISVLRGLFSGFFVSLFPGISSGVATAISVGRNYDDEKYVASISSANTSNAILNFAILQSLGKVRSGSASAFMQFTNPENFYYLPLIASSSAFSALAVTLILSIPFAKVSNRIKPSALSLSVLVYLIASIFLFTGFNGIAVFSLSALIGLLTLLLRVRRIHCMGSIIIPAMLY